MDTAFYSSGLTDRQGTRSGPLAFAYLQLTLGIVTDTKYKYTIAKTIP